VPSFIRLGQFQQLVLLTVVRLGSNAYGIPIQEELEKRSGREVSVGAVYTTLRRLQGKGLLTSWRGQPTPERGGRAKEYFAITARGTETLTDSLGLLKGFFFPDTSAPLNRSESLSDGFPPDWPEAQSQGDAKHTTSHSEGASTGVEQVHLTWGAIALNE
jgi:DNA-binding PadR family transcriptional regulator